LLFSNTTRSMGQLLLEGRGFFNDCTFPEVA